MYSYGRQKQINHIIEKRNSIVIIKDWQERTDMNQLIRELILSKNKLDKIEDKSGNCHQSDLSINS